MDLQCSQKRNFRMTPLCERIVGVRVTSNKIVYEYLIVKNDITRNLSIFDVFRSSSMFIDEKR
jgi:hypothetical protein